MASGVVRLSIDGVEVRLVDTIRLFQRDPFPGGHRYSLSVVGTDVLPGIAPSSSGLAAAEQQEVLWAIERLAALEPGEAPAGPTLYILNSVDVIRRSERGLEIEGVCSAPVSPA